MKSKLHVAATVTFALTFGAAIAATPLVLLVTSDIVTGRPTIEGTTNLPDGAALTVTLSRKASSYVAQSQLKVREGKFISNQFTDHLAPLPPGKYVLEVSGPSDNYSNFSSPLLKRGKYGTTLHYETTLVIPGQSNSAADAAARKAAADDQFAKRQIAAAERKGQEAERKQSRSQGIRIGMSKEDVLASSWGRPDKINTTTNVYGTREQWVYGGRNYLYFESGVLTSIQN